MSAIGLRERTAELVRRRVDELAEELVSRLDPLDQMRWTQGKIDGLREALAIQAEAYRSIGE